MPNVLTFAHEYCFGDAASLTPHIDGVSLAELVAAFERDKGYTDPAGGYGGIVPAHFRLGPLVSYFLGQEEPTEGGDQGEISALFCDCGEAGCWPLVAHVTLTGERVSWERFSQPHRPHRDYSGFGPFEFDRSQYEEAVNCVAAFGDVS